MQNTEKKRALVTGAAGFIGSHLCEQLVKNGHRVYGVDNLSVGRLSNLEGILKNPLFTFSKIDIQNNNFLIDVDWVFHLAARADIVPSIINAAEYHRSNVDGTFRMLEWARKYKAKRFIYAASSSCYGLQEEKPILESAPIDPQYPYALTKYLGEQYVMHWARLYKMPCVSLRLFNAYGPRARTSGTYGAVFGVFLAQMANDKPITIVGDGTQTRDFTYVTDIVDAFIKAAESDYVGILNIGASHPRSINQLAELLGVKKREYIKKRPGEPNCTWSDSKRAREILGWRPLVSFEAGVRELKHQVASFKQAPVWDKESIAKETALWFECLGDTP